MIVMAVDMGRYWTPLQSHYFPAYLSSSRSAGKGRYRFLYVVYPEGWRMALNQDIVQGAMSNGPGPTSLFALSDQARRAGANAIEWRFFPDLDNATAYEWLRQGIYDDKNPWELVRAPVFVGLVLTLMPFAWTMYRDRRTKRESQRGHVIRGPRLVTPHEFNRLKYSDGVGFQTLEPLTMGERLFGCDSERRMVRIPRHEENSHFVLMGDSGTGKSSLIRQMLLQIRMRGEIAVVYDPAMEYTPQFLDPAADVILNPTDQRMPFWTPSDEVQYPPEAMALAESLFPDKPPEKTFFTEAARKIFAHLLRYQPTPQDLVQWMRNMDEIDQRVAGTELEAMIPKGARSQRAAVQGTFNLAAAAFQFLPNEEEAQGRWSISAWVRKGEGWIFLPSTPTLRESLRPLLSMWLDSLILRLMDRKGTSPVWFVLDELASLQRLPQLHVAIAEGRKSNIRLVLGLQGRSQVETIYGHQAEAMLSQPMTKVFLRTSEPHAAEWISRSIGEVEVMRLEETHTQSIPALFQRFQRSKSSRWHRRTEPLVMASTIEGLHNLTGYVKSRDLAVPASFAFLPMEARYPSFIPRPLPQFQALTLSRVAAGGSDKPISIEQTRKSSSRKVIKKSHKKIEEPELFS
jgi:hypothetical protein